MSNNAGQDADGEGGFVPIVVLVLGFVVGGYVLWERPFDTDATYVRWILLALSAAAVVYVGWGFNQARSGSGAKAAVAWLFGGLGGGTSLSTTADSTTEQAPPIPEPLKDEVRLTRAGGRCEYCREETDRLEVHHIKPRSEGGPNTRPNLIALCSNCRAKADRGVYSRSELRDMVRQREAQQEVEPWKQ